MEGKKSAARMKSSVEDCLFILVERVFRRILEGARYHVGSPKYATEQ